FYVSMNLENLYIPESRLILAAMKSTYLFVVNVIKKLMLLNLLQRTDMKKANTPHKYIGFLTFTFYFRREFYIFFKNDFISYITQYKALSLLPLLLLNQ